MDFWDFLVEQDAGVMGSYSNSRSGTDPKQNPARRRREKRDLSVVWILRGPNAWYFATKGIRLTPILAKISVRRDADRIFKLDIRDLFR